MNIVVSLADEARPLIDHFRLVRRSGKHPYPVYTNGPFTLIISGVGKLFSAAATAYLQALTIDKGPTAWLNLGIAGHRDLEIGQGFIAHRIIDQATQRCYYPPLIFPFPCPTSDLVTVDHPEKDYFHPAGYDMESSGFYKIALRSTTIEWIYCYKVVSDTPRHPVEKITKTSVIRLMASRLDEIEILLSALTDAVKHDPQSFTQNPDFDLIIRRWSFTETQKIQLKKLLQRWKTLHGDHLSSQVTLEAYPNSKIFLADIKEQLAHHPMTF